MNKQVCFVFVFLLHFFVGNHLVAQCNCPVPLENGYCLGNEPGTAKEKAVLLQDAAKNKDYKTGYDAYKWFLEKLPAYHKSLYQNGEIVLNGMVVSETDPQKRKVYLEEFMACFDRRIACFGEEATVLTRKGSYAFPYLASDESKIDFLFELYNKIYKLTGDKTNENMLDYLMSTVALKKQKTKTTPSDDEILELFDKLEKTLDIKIAAAEGDAKKKLEDLNDKFFDLLSKSIKFDCDLAINKLCPKFRQDQDDLGLARLIEKSMKECRDNECYIFTVTNLFNRKPTASTAEAIENLYKLRYGKALEAKNEVAQNEALKEIEKWTVTAVELCEKEGCSRLYDLKLELAKMKRNQGKYVESRSILLEIASKDKEKASDCYNLIGDMYLSSSTSCVGNSDDCTRYGFAIAAFEMYQRAGNQAAMNKAMNYFPLKSDCFVLALEDGTPINLNCWIGGQVNLRTRKSK
jgi:hypothetical protein